MIFGGGNAAGPAHSSLKRPFGGAFLDSSSNNSSEDSSSARHTNDHFGLPLKRPKLDLLPDWKVPRYLKHPDEDVDMGGPGPASSLAAASSSGEIISAADINRTRVAARRGVDNSLLRSESTTLFGSAPATNTKNATYSVWRTTSSSGVTGGHHDMAGTMSSAGGMLGGGMSRSSSGGVPTSLMNVNGGAGSIPSSLTLDADAMMGSSEDNSPSRVQRRKDEMRERYLRELARYRREVMSTSSGPHYTPCHGLG